MIRVLGGPKRLCDGLTRRDLLHVGSLSLLGLGLGGGAASADLEPARPLKLGRFGQAKSCILLFLYGSPSQLETFDPKPDAPVGIRGELKSIPSSVPGLDVCELLPHLSQVMDKTTVIRSVSHPNPVHGVAYATTGNPAITIPMELSPRDPNHWPFIGSVVDYIESQKQAAGGRAVPRNMVLPFAFSSQRVGEVARAGPYGGFLGSAWDPIFTEFQGAGTRKAAKTLADKTWEDFELYRGVTPESRFLLGNGSDLGPALTLDRLDRRRSLLDQFEDARRDLDRSIGSSSGIERRREMAYSLIASKPLREAFDLDQEDASTRELYGMTLFGQATLTARRLVEAGGRFLTVFWDEYGLAGTGWDTHWEHFPRMKDELLPGLDRTLSGLLIDLDRRGMLDETLVVCLSEHGRTPKLSLGRGGGRDHWSRCYSVLMAGGGIARGRVVGRSDSIASDPVDRRVSPKDILATMYHLMGIDPATTLVDRQGQAVALTPTGEVIPEVIA